LIITVENQSSAGAATKKRQQALAHVHFPSPAVNSVSSQGAPPSQGSSQAKKLQHNGSQRPSAPESRHMKQVRLWRNKPAMPMDCAGIFTSAFAGCETRMQDSGPAGAILSDSSGINECWQIPFERSPLEDNAAESACTWQEQSEGGIILLQERRDIHPTQLPHGKESVQGSARLNGH
jgi:hypothetical protein